MPNGGVRPPVGHQSAMTRRRLIGRAMSDTNSVGGQIPFRVRVKPLAIAGLMTSPELPREFVKPWSSFGIISRLYILPTPQSSSRFCLLLLRRGMLIEQHARARPGPTLGRRHGSSFVCPGRSSPRRRVPRRRDARCRRRDRYSGRGRRFRRCLARVVDRFDLLGEVDLRRMLWVLWVRGSPDYLIVA